MTGLHSSQHLESETSPRREPPVHRFSNYLDTHRSGHVYLAMPVRPPRSTLNLGEAVLTIIEMLQPRAGRKSSKIGEGRISGRSLPTAAVLGSNPSSPAGFATGPGECPPPHSGTCNKGAADSPLLYPLQAGGFCSEWIKAFLPRCRAPVPLCQTSCRLNRIGTLGARIAESGSIRTGVQRPDSGEAVAAGEFVGGACIA
jgi:hypothetical protein